MRIAMLSWESMHSVAIGGLAPHVTELSCALHRLGHEVHIYTRVGDGQSPYDCIDGVHYHRCPYQRDADFMTDIVRMNESFVWHLGETEHHLGNRFDVIHGHDWLSVDALRLLKNIWHRPIVMTVHSTEYGRCGNSVWDDPMSRRIRDLEWEGTYIADRVICVSKTLAAEVHNLYDVPEDKIYSIYNGVDARKYEAAVDVPAIRKRCSVPVDDPMVLFAGRITWQKGPDLLLDAIPEVLKKERRAKIVFAGDGDMRPGLETRASQMGIANSTRFLGHRTGRDLVGLFKGTDVVCVPSRNEPFGIVILEAWSASKPVVATRIGGPAEFVKDHHNGITVGTGIDSISDGLMMMLSDRDAASKMGRNGRVEAVSKFSWNNSAVDTEKVYEILAGDSGPDIAHSGNGRLTPGMPITYEHIRRRAYDIYRARNGKPGNPFSDWLEAERQLKAELEAATQTGALASKASAPTTKRPGSPPQQPPAAQPAAKS